MMMARTGPIVAIATITWILGGVHGAPYFGKFLGKLSELHHGVSGEVYAVDGRTLYLKDFTYDGQGPAAYFYASTGRTADKAGFRLRDENGSPEVIKRYRKEGVTLTLPEGKTLNNIKIFYVWCEEFEVNFGDIKIPRNFDYPRPQKIDPLKGVHAISSDNIVIVDAQTLLIPNLSFDGQAPDAKFWVGRGPKPSPQGIRVPDENGKEVPLRRYDRKTVVLTLPSDLTVFDIGHFGIWCEAFTVDFGHVQIPQNLNVPPSLKMLGVSPQSKLNCEVLYDDLAFEVRWAVAGDSIVLQLVAKLDEREYVSFGISGDDTKSVMVGGDVAVAWVDKTTLKGFAEDYYLDKSQCSGPTGSCPDNRLRAGTNSIRLLNAAMVNGYSIVTYQRALKASDEYDRPIYTNRSQPIIWAIGPLNQRNEVSFHSHYTKGDRTLDFGRAAKWNCPMPEGDQPPMRAIPQTVRDEATTAAPAKSRNPERRRGGGRTTTTTTPAPEPQRRRQNERRGGTRNRDQVAQRGSTSVVRTVPTPSPVSKRDAWAIPAIQCYEPEDGVFYAQMGPTGGKRGYPAITGHVGWGISWYINGLLIPEINVVRGKTYTFVVEGGSDPEVPAKFHPFYITDDSIGGYEYKTAEERKNVRIFAGALTAKDGTVRPTGTGRLCHWTQQGDLDADDFDSFGAYQRTLELKCDQGEPGVIQWTPDRNTPDTVYYQCFTHRYLGWKINVLDSCNGQASEPEPVRVEAPESVAKDKSSDLEDSPSIRVETRVKPNDIVTEDKDDIEVSTSVSETTNAPDPITDPPQITSGQPQMQLPNEPILIHHQQPLQQSFYSPPPPQPIYMNQGPFFVPSGYHSPYIFEPPVYYAPYRPNSFKPSPPMGAVREELVLRPELLEITTVPSSTTVTPATTTTQTVITTTEKPQVITPKPIDTLVAAMSEVRSTNQNPLLPYRPINLPPIPPNMALIMRRPFGPKPKVQYSPYKMPIRNHQMFKKPIYRLPPIRQVPKRPYFRADLHDIQKFPVNYIILKPQTIVPQQTSTTSPPTIPTEKEPEIQTIAPSSLLSTSSAKDQIFEVFRLPPALNTGFHPESVIVESGFKPIVSKQFENRMAEDDIDIEDIGVVDLNQEPLLPQLPQSFEPVFVPSPIDKPMKLKPHKRPYVKKVIIKRARSLPPDSDLEPEAAAAERVESYYLPPPGRLSKISKTQQPSNIDLESPPDVVVTYDGRKVSGASLTARLADRSSILDMRASKAAELIKARPQFAPFKGELPPLNPDIINRNLPQLQDRGLISRDLDTPAVRRDTGSIKLNPVKQITWNGGQISERRKREAHHTAEHTAEQERRRSTKNSAVPLLLQSQVLVVVVAYLLA